MPTTITLRLDEDPSYRHAIDSAHTLNEQAREALAHAGHTPDQIAQMQRRLHAAHHRFGSGHLRNPWSVSLHEDTHTLHFHKLIFARLRRPDPDALRRLSQAQDCAPVQTSLVQPLAPFLSALGEAATLPHHPAPVLIVEAASLTISLVLDICVHPHLLDLTQRVAEANDLWKSGARTPSAHESLHAMARTHWVRA